MSSRTLTSLQFALSERPQNAYKDSNSDGCLCSGSNSWVNRMYFCFSSFWINYDWFILVRYVDVEKYMCLEEDKLWQLQDKHYEFWCFHSNNGIFWMVDCTFHIDHDMCCFCFSLMGEMTGAGWFWLSLIRQHVQYRNIVLVICQFFSTNC